ncbi:MAG: response regulator [Methanobacteriota archaeon]
MAKIMVVDDDPDHVFVLKIALRREGYEVAEAYSGTECLNKISHVKPDLVILDIMMSDMNGWDVCKRIRRYKEELRIELGKLISTAEALLKRTPA